MRLLHFAETGTVVGGVERYLAALLAGGGAASGIEHAVVTHAPGTCEYAGPWPATAWPWMAPRTSAPAGPPTDGAVPLFHAPPSPAAIAALGRAPFAVFCHDHRWWCPSGTRFYLRPERPCGIHASTMSCGLRYHVLRCGSLRPGPTLEGFVRAAVGREALGQAAVVLCASEFMAREAVRHGAKSAAVHVAPLPVTMPTDAAPPPAAGIPLILCASRLTPEKGIEQLLDAFARMRTAARLALAGGGILEERVADVVSVHPRRDRITIAGQLGDAALRALFAEARVIAVPSVWPEPFGLVGIEALAWGRPVVSSGAGGTTDWSRAEFGVLTADPFDTGALAAALDRVLAESVWADRARSAGAAWVRARHGLDAHVAALTAALAPLAAQQAA